MDIGQKLVLGQNQYVIASKFSHHIGNVLFYQLVPTIVQNQSEVNSLIQSDDKSWVESKQLTAYLETKQAVLVEDELAKVQAG